MFETVSCFGLYHTLFRILCRLQQSDCCRLCCALAMARRLDASACNLGYGLGYELRQGVQRRRYNEPNPGCYELRYDSDPEYRLVYDTESDPDYGEVGSPAASRSKAKPPLRVRANSAMPSFPPPDATISLDETVSLLQEMSDRAAHDDAHMAWPEITSSGGGDDESFVLPPRMPERGAASVVDTLRANATGVRALRAHLKKEAYNLTPEENSKLDLREANGKVDCTLVVDGFPVYAANPWLDPAGNGLARSMVPHAIELGSCELLDNFCRVDIFPGARHYREGKRLDRKTMAETAR